jgi:hypothetical protein
MDRFTYLISHNWNRNRLPATAGVPRAVVELWSFSRRHTNATVGGSLRPINEYVKG